MDTIGIDFDNTIVCYHDLFHRLAREGSLIPASLPVSKCAVRDYLRQTGREADWTELQGIIYGPRLFEAEPFPGVLTFLERCHHRGIRCRIISHKTRYAVRGEKHDLHQASLDWLQCRGILGPRTGLGLGDVFLEETRAAKLARLAAERCDLCIDDLPEFLTEPGFPAGVERILFDPSGSASPGPYRRCRSWQEIAQLVFAVREAPAP